MEDGLVLDNDTNKVIAKYPVLILVVMEDGLVLHWHQVTNLISQS